MYVAAQLPCSPFSMMVLDFGQYQWWNNKLTPKNFSFFRIKATVQACSTVSLWSNYWWYRKTLERHESMHITWKNKEKAYSIIVLIKYCNILRMEKCSTFLWEQTPE